MIYATTSSMDGRINPHGDIQAFDTVEAAHKYLMRVFDNGHWNLESAVIAPGRFGDYWLRAYEEPDSSFNLSPFSREQVVITQSGEEWWVTPTEPVLVVTKIEPLPRPIPRSPSTHLH